jgi:predicted nucleic acid-binding protein
VTTVFLDTAVIMYAAGREHSHKAACAAVMDRVGTGDLDAVISIEVVQEIVHRYLSMHQPQTGREMANHALDVFAPVLPVTHDVMQRTVDLLERYQTVQSRDLVHVATCLVNGIDSIISPDTDFDAIAEITRIAPEDVQR